MIARSIASPQICLRCQLRLCQRQTAQGRMLASYKFRRQHTNALVDSTDEKEIEAEQDALEGSAVPVRSRRVLTRRKEALNSYRERVEIAKQGAQLPVVPVGYLHGFREHALRANVRELDVDALGKPAEVIVLKDSGIRYSFSQPRVENIDGDTDVDILARLDSERGLADDTEVAKNIDGLQPRSDGEAISWDEFKAIEEQLNDGFTSAQLATYIRSHRVGRRRKPAADEQANIFAPVQDASTNRAGSDDTRSSHISRISRWMPGISETGSRFEESPLRGYISDIAFTHKQRLVVQLMRQCWQLEVMELTDSVGELEMQIESQALELLINGDKPPLGSISAQSILNEDEQIEVFRSRHVIRITATKHKATSIVKEINGVLNNIKYIELDLNVLSPAPGILDERKKGTSVKLNQAVLAELHSLTGAEMDQLQNGKLAITSIDERPLTALSTPNDIVRRLLLTSLYTAGVTFSYQACKKVDEPLVAVRYEPTAGLPWHNRLRQWSRWATSIQKSKQTETPSPMQDSELNLGVISKPASLEIRHKSRSPGTRSSVSGHVHWEESSFTTTSAVPGYILHEFNDIDAFTATLSDMSTNHETTFMPTSQNISRFLGLDHKSTKTKPVASLRMRFLPNPWKPRIGQVANMRLPPIEMHFRIDPISRNLELRHTIAITETAIADVMLPDRALDLRFRQLTTARLVTPDDEKLPQIADFLNASQLNLSRGALITPPNLILPISPNICFSENYRGDFDEALVDTEYLFAGLEYRTSLATMFKGWTLLYTSIEGGKANGRRSELTLRSGLAPQSKHRYDASWIASQEPVPNPFIHDAFRLIDVLEDPDNINARDLQMRPLVVKPFQNVGFFGKMLNPKRSRK